MHCKNYLLLSNRVTRGTEGVICCVQIGSLGVLGALKGSFAALK